VYTLAPNIELLFTEAGEYPDRVRAAAAAGFTAVEMWGPTGKDAPAKPKDVPALRAALEETGVALTAQLAEPRMQFMIPPRDHEPFYAGLDEGVAIAQELGCPRIVVGSGTGFGGRKRQDQLDELIDIFSRGVAQIAGSGITLVLEAVNTRVDHPGALLDRTFDGPILPLSRGLLGVGHVPARVIARVTSIPAPEAVEPTRSEQRDRSDRMGSRACSATRWKTAHRRPAPLSQASFLGRIRVRLLLGRCLSACRTALLPETADRGAVHAGDRTAPAR
jgi:hypothetical protein